MQAQGHITQEECSAARSLMTDGDAKLREAPPRCASTRMDRNKYQKMDYKGGKCSGRLDPMMQNLCCLCVEEGAVAVALRLVPRERVQLNLLPMCVLGCVEEI